jgi:Reverse transcriptase (RNA-dependent DNA polymerase)
MGYHIGFFVGALAYADDLVLSAPSANAMRRVLQICDEYAAQFEVVINASKTECFCCHRNSTTDHTTHAACLSLLSFPIGSELIEFVDKWPHLGHIITNDVIDTEDILANKFSRIGQIN